MEKVGRLGALAFVYGLLAGGALANLLGDFLAPVTAGIAIGALGGGAYGLARRRRHASPWDSRPALNFELTVGSLLGGVIGVAVAFIDAVVGG